jgi:DNA-binding CsgD family transcriptional regulator
MLKPGNKPEKIISLSKREEDIIKMITAGYTNREIAEIRNNTINTIRSYRKIIYYKLGLHSSVSLVKYGRER